MLTKRYRGGKRRASESMLLVADTAVSGISPPELSYYIKKSARWRIQITAIPFWRNIIRIHQI
jgi:hypothetical protein